MCCVDQRHVGHGWPHIHTDATGFSRHTNNVDQTPAFHMDTTPKLGQRPTQNAAPQHLNTWQLKVPAKTPTRKTSNRREAANGRASSQQMQDRVFDLRIKQVSIPLRKTRRLHNTGQHARQRKEKRASRIGARRFFTAKNAPFHGTVNVVRHAWLTHGHWCKPSLGPLHLFQGVLRPSKHTTIKNVQHQFQSGRMAQPGVHSICPATVCAHEEANHCTT